MTRSWPLLSGTAGELPARGGPGSFWEDRGDRRHCGIDLYAPAGSRVVAVEEGIVARVGEATSDHVLPYWRTTSFVVIQTASGLFWKYAELAWVGVRQCDRIDAGEEIGSVGEVIDPSKVSADAPPYIRHLAATGRTSMLHLEVYATLPPEDGQYLGGNWFGKGRPRGILDPGAYLPRSGV